MHFSPEELEVLARARPSAAHRWLARSGDVGVFAVIDHGAAPAIGALCVGQSAEQAPTLDEACRLARSLSIRAGVLGLPHAGMAMVAVAHPRLDPRALAALLRDRLADADVRAYPGHGLEGTDASLGPRVREAAAARATLRGAVLEACVRPLLSLEGCTAVVLDAGPVGRDLAGELHARGARVRPWDAHPPRAAALAEALGVEPLDVPWAEADVDLLVPCGPAAVIDASIAARLGARVVCGPSSQIFVDARAREALEARERRAVPEVLAATAELIDLATAEGWLEHDDAVATIEQTAREVLAEPSGAQRRAIDLAVSRSTAAASS